MKRSIKSLIGFTMWAADGEIGVVRDFYFEDDSWTVRYMIVEAGGWLYGRKVLISTDAHLIPDWENKTFPVTLTKVQIQTSPDIDTELPVYRQEEIKLYDHYALGNYWQAGFVGGGVPLPMTDRMAREDHEISERKTSSDPHLRSIGKVAGYKVAATDGAIGTIKDLIIDDTNWRINAIVVATGNWFSERHVLISPTAITQIKWDSSEVLLDIDLAHTKECPEYDINELWAL